MVTRQTLLAPVSVTATLAALGITPEALTADRVKLGDAAPFSFNALTERTRVMADKPYTLPATTPANILSKIDYKAHGKIKFDTAHALSAGDPGRFPVTFFHLGMFFRAPVRMHVVEKSAACEIVYDESYSDMPTDSLARKLPHSSGFTGFHFQKSRLGDQKKLSWKRDDWAAFLGVLCFHAIGGLYQYGLSAQNTALDMAQANKPEGFPNSTHVWFNTPADNYADSVTIYTLLDGLSITGTYHFIIHCTKDVVMDIDATTFLRKGIDRLGIAPTTLMHWFSETAKGTTTDWRPKVYDSDGLAPWASNGERIWRPPDDPPYMMASALGNNNPRGFGLLQRDRDFNNYQDGVHYERRPSLWVEPLEGWDEGAVQLIEIPTGDEIRNNIVAMWVPRAPAHAGSQYHLRYRLHWLADEPYPTQPARCVATRIDNGGQPGQPRPRGVRRFMVEFKGGPLEKLPFGAKSGAVLNSSRDTFLYILTGTVPNSVPRHWRTRFDLTVDGKEPVDMRLFLRVDGKPLSKAWLYQYHPFQPPMGPVAS